MTTTGNHALDALADAIATRVLDRMKTAEGPRLLLIREAAAYLGVGRRTFDRLLSEGVIPIVKRNGFRRVDRADLDKWIDSGKGK